MQPGPHIQTQAHPRLLAPQPASSCAPACSLLARPVSPVRHTTSSRKSAWTAGDYVSRLCFHHVYIERGRTERPLQVTSQSSPAAGSDPVKASIMTALPAGHLLQLEQGGQGNWLISAEPSG